MYDLSANSEIFGYVLLHSWGDHPALDGGCFHGDALVVVVAALAPVVQP